MAYSPNMPAAARRHLQAADLLKDTHRLDVAGYLYGIAAECAIKAMLIDAGFRRQEERRTDPLYMHYPYLRTALLDRLGGRRVVPLMHFVANPRFLQNWSTEMRYCKGDEIAREWVQRWEDQARQAVASMGT